MTKILVNGACGRMGRAVLKAVADDTELTLVGAVDVHGGADTGELAGLAKNGIIVETDLSAALSRLRPDVMIDFTRPDVVFQNVLTALSHKVSPVVGTTGLTDAQKEEIRRAAEANDTPAFIAPNFAIGAVLMMLMSRMAAQYLPDVEIIEMHHDNKLDAPSGTAVQTAAMIAEVCRGIRMRRKRLWGHAAHSMMGCAFTAFVCPAMSLIRRSSSAGLGRRSPFAMIH